MTTSVLSLVFALLRTSGLRLLDCPQRVFDIIHPARRNLTAIRGYVRLGGLPDNPRTDPQDRAWFGPHDRLFTEEETVPIDFKPGPDYGAFLALALALAGTWVRGR